MIDKLVLKRLMVDCGFNGIYSEENTLKLANACAEYGKSKCAAGEWLDYPENSPDKGKKYFVENIHGIYEIIDFDGSALAGQYWIECVKRFAEIKG